MRQRAQRGWDALVLVLIASVLLEVLVSDQDVPLALAVPVGLAMTLSLVWGQRAPVPVAAVVLVAWVVQALSGDWQQEPQAELLPVCVVFWSLGAYVAPRRGRWAVAAAMVLLAVHQYDDLVVLGPLMLGIFAAGRLMQSREALAHELREQRAQAERFAVAEERARIARDLHDVVGHAISVMTVQAGAERMALGRERPETTRVLEQIESTGRQTLQEMRRLVGVLRAEEDVAALAPQPGLAQLDELAERLRRSGLAVQVEIVGDRSPLPAGVDVTAYRILQEALTNVLTHADTGTARVTVTHGEDAVALQVEDDGTGHPGQAHGSPGHGLVGMRERVEMYGGTLEVGPRAGGGWRVAARLPREGAP